MPNLDWPDLGHRIGRQTVQVVLPALVAVAAGQHGVDWDTLGGLLLIAAVGAVVTVLKAWGGAVSQPGDSWVVQATERAASAVVAVLGGYTLAGPLSDLLALPWDTIGWSCLGAAGIAVAALITNPPALTKVTLTPVRDDRGSARTAAMLHIGAAMLAIALLGWLISALAPNVPTDGAWRVCPAAGAHKPWQQVAHDTCQQRQWRGVLVVRVRGAYRA